MLKIKGCDVIIARLAPKEDHVEDQIYYAMDCRVVMAVMQDTDKVLAALRVPALADALWNADGVPVLNEAQIKLRHQIPNVACVLKAHGEYVEFTADLGQIKLTPLPAHGLELDCKIRGRIEPRSYLSVWAMKIDGNVRGEFIERQMDIESIAA